MIPWIKQFRNTRSGPGNRRLHQVFPSRQMWLQLCHGLPGPALGPQIWDLVRSWKISQRWPEALESSIGWVSLWKNFIFPNRPLEPQICELARSWKICQQWPQAQEVVLSGMEHLHLSIIMATWSDLSRGLEISR